MIAGGTPYLAATANYTGAQHQAGQRRAGSCTDLMHDDYDDQAAGSPRRAAGELEAAALAVLQASGSALTPGQVLDRLGGGLAYTTVVTILSRLHAKGVLTRLRSGRAYSYAPVADEPGLAARRMRGVLD